MSLSNLFKNLTGQKRVARENIGKNIINSESNNFHKETLANLSLNYLIEHSSSNLDYRDELFRRYESQQRTIDFQASKLLELEGLISSLSTRLNILQDQYDRDFLTGLYTRRSFETKSHKAIRSSLEGRVTILNSHENILESSGFVYGVLDLDNFKDINDKCPGKHQTGDEILISFAKTLQSSFSKKGDIVARWGGEEFTVLVPTKNLTNFISYLDTVFGEIREIVHPEITDRKITVSGGFVYFNPMIEDVSLKDIHKLADLSLYDAKQKFGKDNYVLQSLQ